MTVPADPSLRHFLRMLVAGTAALAAGCATTDSAERVGTEVPEEGFEYREARQRWPVATPGKLEVAEFFWFGCPHCNAFEPVLDEWRKRLPPDVSFRKVHPGLAPHWAVRQQLFYTLEAMGKAEELNSRIFRAIHDDKIALDSQDRMAAFLEPLGVDRQRFVATFESADVRDRMAQADRMAEAFGLQGVPGLAVNGRWFTSPTLAGSRVEALRVVDYLLARERRGGA